MSAGGRKRYFELTDRELALIASVYQKVELAEPDFFATIKAKLELDPPRIMQNTIVGGDAGGAPGPPGPPADSTLVGASFERSSLLTGSGPDGHIDEGESVSIAWEDIIYDLQGFYNGLNPDRIVCPVDYGGYYHVDICVIIRGYNGETITGGRSLMIEHLDTAGFLVPPVPRILDSTDSATLSPLSPTNTPYGMLRGHGWVHLEPGEFLRATVSNSPSSGHTFYGAVACIQLHRIGT